MSADPRFESLREAKSVLSRLAADEPVDAMEVHEAWLHGSAALDSIEADYARSQADADVVIWRDDRRKRLAKAEEQIDLLVEGINREIENRNAFEKNAHAEYERRLKAEEALREIADAHQHGVDCYSNYNDPTHTYCGKPTEAVVNLARAYFENVEGEASGAEGQTERDAQSGSDNDTGDPTPYVSPSASPTERLRQIVLDHDDSCSDEWLAGKPQVIEILGPCDCNPRPYGPHRDSCRLRHTEPRARADG